MDYQSHQSKRASIEIKAPMAAKGSVAMETSDKILVAIKGEKKKGIIVGAKQNQKTLVPKFDTNNLVLIDDNGTPLGTRIHVPIPTVLRTILKEKTQAKGADYTKLLAIATRFV
ncbi:unnamed protein product [Timema podura]|uniref:Large ribosomal subunit protein uL14m n=1 Tax=Timema podura TaxID=61482 RepID=A0ABN7NH89_TIMPD|nr:unnamed protein product [Timema podura]